MRLAMNTLVIIAVSGIALWLVASGIGFLMLVFNSHRERRVRQ
jgi:hypothetical protein